ncbi:complex proteins associated with Set1p component shg1-domain-containing protein [Sphaerosporella brunnea]|uniref:Complex proteins associated with Set1p component shg1-domain-containing protein n=1 Tax=Sphaerosporella brunnea TaxID=1250544 RepID=A0A5J5ECI9_9PEZI|nr:complex proteins associated with Set1p component shg1-domain-containing protein [Sphaerosporella brunnea]
MDFKKRGHFDSIKKETYNQFLESRIMVELLEKLQQTTDSELDRDGSLMARDRARAAAMIEKVAEQRGVYSQVEALLDDLLETKCDEVDGAVRELMVSRGMMLSPAIDNGAGKDDDMAKMADHRQARGKETRGAGEGHRDGTGEQGVVMKDGESAISDHTVGTKVKGTGTLEGINLGLEVGQLGVESDVHGNSLSKQSLVQGSPESVVLGSDRAVVDVVEMANAEVV